MSTVLLTQVGQMWRTLQGAPQQKAHGGEA